MQRPAATLFPLAALLALLGAGWSWLQAPDAGLAPLQGSAVRGEAPGALRPATITPGGSMPTFEASDARVATPASGARTARVFRPSRATTVPDAGTRRPPPFDLDVQFIGPDGYLLPLGSVDVELRVETGAPRRVSAAAVSQVRIEEVDACEAELLVHAPGHTHWPQRVTLDPARTTSNRHGVRVQTVTTTVWPTTWIAVLVETPGGEPFPALAGALGLPAQPLFSDAFRARVSAVAPSGANRVPAHDPALATFRAAPGEKAYVIDERAVGSLELLRDPPSFVGLELYGAVLRWEPLSANAREVRFVLSPEELDAGLARLELVVVDRDTGAPLEGTLGGLRADSAAARRSDHSDLPSAADGKLVFTRIVPGRYELWIQRGEAQHQDYIELARGDRRDLGIIELGSGVGIDIEVVDGAGQPAVTSVEVGRYAPGLRPIEMYPQMIRHSSDGSGHVRVPSSSGLMVVRATVHSGRFNAPGNVQEVSGVRSPHVVVDPQNLATGPIRLVLTEPIRVTIATTHVGTTRIDVLDSTEVVIARRSGAREVVLEALPGPHRVRLYDASGAVLREVAVELAQDLQRVQVD